MTRTLKTPWFFLWLVVLTLGLAGPLAGEAFWDDPESATPPTTDWARFPTTVSNSRTGAAFWQERRGADGWVQSFLGMSVRSLGDTGWTTRQRVLGPFTFAGSDAKSEAQFYSAVLTQAGTFFVAILDEKGEVILYRSENNGASFIEDGRIQGGGTLLSPRLFLGLEDQPILAVTKAEDQTFRINISRRSQGKWGSLQTVTDDPLQKQSAQPTIIRNGEALTLVYQNLFTGVSPTYQIYRKDSQDGGLTWGPSTRISDFKDELFDKPDEVDNQRPSAQWFGGRLFVSWERRTSATQPMVIVAQFAADGKRTTQYMTEATFMARNPQLYTHSGELRMTWFDNERQTSTFDLSSRTWSASTGWGANNEVMARDTGNTALGQPVSVGTDLYFFFQVSFLDQPSVGRLQPDRRVAPPTLAANNFDPLVQRNRSDFNLTVQFPRDPSGIAGFNTLLTQDSTAEPTKERRFEAGEARQSVQVPQEGQWYLAVAVQDGAGNWSGTTRISLRLKTTPPGQVLMDLPETDPQGYLVSNTVRLGWKPTTSDTVAYAWRWTRVGETLTQALIANLKTSEPVMVPSTEASASAINLEDGLWTLSVAAFDEAGNRGKTTSFFFRLNKFLASTVITSVEATQDNFGRVVLAVRGRGFLADGAVYQVFLDRDGAAPYDLVLPAGRFRVATDRLIDGIRVEGLSEGIYRVGVNHPTRGRVFSGPVVKIEPSGTVKVGDFRNIDQTVWEFFSGVTVFFSVHALYFWSVLLFLALTLLASLRLLALTWAESREIASRAKNLFSDHADKWAKRPGRTTMKTKGLGLRVKFAASILGLTGSVILILSITLGFFVVENSQRSLGTALRQRTQVLLDSLASGVRTYMPTKDSLGLGDLPPLTTAMNGEALYATITGPSLEANKAGFSYVWASNDPELSKKIGGGSISPGVSTLKDVVEPVWAELQKQLNEQAAAAVGPEVEGTIDPAAITRIKAKLNEVAGQARSFPEFDTQRLLDSKNQNYLFYQPVLNFKKGDPNYVLGLVRIEVSTQAIIKEITASRDQLVFLTLILSLIALVLGLVGAFILSALTINPIRKLVAGVEKIRDTEDKTMLSDHVIKIGTKDELEDLASTVNQMTRGLVDGAGRTQDLTKGKIEQKTLFIPLDKDSEKRKRTTFYRDFPEIEVSAYYEGAKLVSGDLYEIRQLDTRDGKNPDSPWYGVMKGDVAGKGVEAGMIMAIAAMFITTFFRNWTEAKDAKDTKIDKLLYQINDTIEPILAEAERGLFVALNVGILNTHTGQLRFCNAGDNLLHIWRGRTQHYEVLKLPECISVGAMPSYLHKVRYENQDLQLESGDTLLYFTDGLEDSNTYFRDADWNPVAYFDPDDPSTQAPPYSIRSVPVFADRPEGPRKDQNAIEYEKFDSRRLEEVIDAYYHKKPYELTKKNWYHPEHRFHFDLSTCDGSPQELITALTSIDRVYRLVPDPKNTADDVIDIDLVQDAFLRKHFVEYTKYFKNGFEQYEKGDPAKNQTVDAEGYRLNEAKRVPVWEKGAPGEEVDKDGYKLVDGDRVAAYEKGDPKKKDDVDSEGFRLVNGRRVQVYEKGDPKHDVVDSEGYKLVGGKRILINPGYIRYAFMKEDAQFDDLTLLAIRKK